MKINYSPLTGNFYPLNIDYGDKLPADVITVNSDLYDQVMSRPVDTNFSIVDGQAVITPIPPPEYAPQAAAYMTTVRDLREKILTRITGIWVASDSDDLKAACKVARQNLLDLPQNPGIQAATNLDDLKSAVLSAYRAIVEASPAEIRNAFNEVDS